LMSDRELQAIRRDKLRALQRKLAAKQEKAGEIGADAILNKVFKDRAWEVFNSASSQFPDVMSKVKEALVKLVLSGKLREVTGEQLYLFLRKLGLRVRLDIKIRYMDHGQLMSLAEKIQKDLPEA
jgi:DNA-binding TFAR19-related protein (PDSD5 family)